MIYSLLTSINGQTVHFKFDSFQWKCQVLAFMRLRSTIFGHLKFDYLLDYLSSSGYLLRHYIVSTINISEHQME